MNEECALLSSANGGVHRAAANDSPMSNRSAPRLRVQRIVLLRFISLEGLPHLAAYPFEQTQYCR